MPVIVNFHQISDLDDILWLKQDDELEKKFPELVPCKENLYNAMDAYYRYYYGWGKNNMLNRFGWLVRFLRYNDIVGNKKFIMNNDTINLMDYINDRNLTKYLFMYGSLFYPEDIKAYDLDLYIRSFHDVMRIIFKQNIKKTSFKSNKKLYKFLTVVEDLQKKYHGRFNNNSFQSTITILLSHCYINDDYTLLYNFLSNPNYYFDRLIVKGYIKSAKKNCIPNWDTFGKQRVFDEATDIFNTIKDEKKAIM